MKWQDNKHTAICGAIQAGTYTVGTYSPGKLSVV